jgi:acyl carrier protein
MDVESELREHIAREFLRRDDGRLAPGADLTLLLDSVHLMLLARHVEDAYHIEVGDGELSLDHFESVEKLAAFVRRKRA